MAYTVCVEARERLALAAVSAGAEPSLLAQIRDEFDAGLVEKPKLASVDSEQLELRRALGVA